MGTRLDDASITGIGKLCAENVTHGVAHFEHPANPGADRSGQRQRFEYVATANNDLSVTISKPTFHDTDRRDLLIGHSEGRAQTVSTPIHVAGQAGDSFDQN